MNFPEKGGMEIKSHILYTECKLGQKGVAEVTPSIQTKNSEEFASNKLKMQLDPSKIFCEKDFGIEK